MPSSALQLVTLVTLMRQGPCEWASCSVLCAKTSRTVLEVFSVAFSD